MILKIKEYNVECTESHIHISTIERPTFLGNFFKVHVDEIEELVSLAEKAEVKIPKISELELADGYASNYKNGLLEVISARNYFKISKNREVYCTMQLTKNKFFEYIGIARYHAAVSKLAYELWEEDGKPSDLENEFWAKAESLIGDQYA